MYIPNNWVKNTDNLERIHEILEYLQQDIVTDEILSVKEQYIEELKNMGEDIIYKKIKNHEISFY